MKKCKITVLLGLIFITNLLYSQSSLQKGVSIIVEPGVLVRNNGAANDFFSASSLLGNGERFENIESAFNFGVEFRLIDSIYMGVSIQSSVLLDTQHEKGNLGLNRNGVLFSLNHYYFKNNKYRASLGLSFGTSNVSYTVGNNMDTIFLVKNDPLLPYKNYEYTGASFSTSSRVLGIEHKLELMWRKFDAKQKRRLRLISFGITNRLNYCFGSNRWTYNYPNMFHSRKFTNTDLSSSFQFQLGFYARWHLNKKEKNK